MVHVDKISYMRIFSSRHMPEERCCRRGGRWEIAMWNNLGRQVTAAAATQNGIVKNRQGRGWRKGLERFTLQLELAEVNQLQNRIDELHVFRVCLAYELIRNT